MRLVDFLIAVLGAHAQTLTRLAAFFGEDVFTEMLEESGETIDQALPPSKFAKATHADGVIWLDSPHPSSNANAYRELEGAVREFSLPEVLNFHLWAYPHYRAFIESALDLNSRIKSDANSESATQLIEEAVQQASAWVRALPIPPAAAPAAERAAQMPWIRFRTELLKQLGKRPFGAV
jgi:hypothetical protein